MTSSASVDPRIDVVVPVYNAPADVRRCVASVLECTSEPYRLIMIDDASPDPGVQQLFSEIEQRNDTRITLLRNDRNLGFTATANRGMRLSRADVVLLNSDTIVTQGWLQSLVRCAASDPLIATVTPFSNNAEICSFPRFCQNNPWSADSDPEVVRGAIVDAAVPTYPDLPTGVGFCMYVRRAAIDAIGTFDLAFGAGYGEENDFCLRAARAGFRNVLADDAFVVHTGGRSFAGQKVELGGRNLATLLVRHPHYAEMVAGYIAADPLRPLREAACSRLRASSPMPGVLHVIHHHGGGTETHVRELIAASRDRFRHYLVVTIGDRWQLEEHRSDGSVVSFGFERQPNEPWSVYLTGLLGAFHIGLVHLHNISSCREGLIDALASADVPFGYTLHDLNFACPTITFLNDAGRYCGGVTDFRACQRCLDAQPKFAAVDVTTWRDTHARLLARASFILAPSNWAASMFRRYFARANVTVIPHGIDLSTDDAHHVCLGAIMPDDDAPVVAVLGAIGPDKGARRVERLVELMRERDVRLRIVVIGYLDVQPGPWQSEDARLTVHGRYESADLPVLLRHYRARLILYPSAGPETFSYTLSETWRAGVPALVPPIGALEERVSATGAGWVMREDEWADEASMLTRIASLASDEARPERERAARAAQAVVHTTQQQMADATLQHYVAALRDRRPDKDAIRFTNERVRDSLDYRPWHPPTLAATSLAEAVERPVDATPAAMPWMSRVARRALAIRRTPMGRVLYRIAPAPLIDALKARLDT